MADCAAVPRSRGTTPRGSNARRTRYAAAGIIGSATLRADAVEQAAATEDRVTLGARFDRLTASVADVQRELVRLAAVEQRRPDAGAATLI